MKEKGKVIGLALVLAIMTTFLPPLGLPVPIVHASTETVTLYPIADATVDGYVKISYNGIDQYNSQRDTNFGGDDYLRVLNFTTYYQQVMPNDPRCDSYYSGQISFLEFNLSSIPSNVSINSATLKVYLAHDLSSGSSSVEVHLDPSKTWTESRITFNNAPSYNQWPTDTQNGINYQGWYSWDITDDVAAVLLAVPHTINVPWGAYIISEALVPGNPCPSVCEFYSKEWNVPARRPKLEINYTAPPASSSISCSAWPSSINQGSEVTVSGDISPSPSNTVSVTLIYARPNGTQTTRTTTAEPGHPYSDNFAPDMMGTWAVRASWAGDSDYLGATSSLTSFTAKATSSESPPPVIFIGLGAAITAGVVVFLVKRRRTAHRFTQK
jgi:hypothetical protein